MHASRATRVCLINLLAYRSQKRPRLKANLQCEGPECGCPSLVKMTMTQITFPASNMQADRTFTASPTTWPPLAWQVRSTLRTSRECLQVHHRSPLFNQHTGLEVMNPDFGRMLRTVPDETPTGRPADFHVLRAPITYKPPRKLLSAPTSTTTSFA